MYSREECEKMYRDGMTVTEISKKTGVKLDTLKKWRKRFNWNGELTEGTIEGTKTEGTATGGQRRGTDGGQNTSAAKITQKKRGSPENLIPLTQLPPEQAREIRSKGGKASAAKMLENKVNRKAWAEIMSMYAPSKAAESLERVELLEQGEKIDVETARRMRIAVLALEGDLNANKYIDTFVKQDPIYELKLREAEARVRELEIRIKQYETEKNADYDKLDEIIKSIDEKAQKVDNGTDKETG